MEERVLFRFCHFPISSFSLMTCLSTWGCAVSWSTSCIHQNICGHVEVPHSQQGHVVTSENWCWMSLSLQNKRLSSTGLRGDSEKNWVIFEFHSRKPHYFSFWNSACLYLIAKSEVAPDQWQSCERENIEVVLGVIKTNVRCCLLLSWLTF